MNRKKIIGIVALAAAVTLVLLKLISNKQTTESRVYQYDMESPVTVSADTIMLQNIDDINSYTGTFEPNKETRISADVQGKINSVLIEQGSFARKGQALVQLDNSLLKLQLQAVEVQIEGLEDDVKRYTILTEADAVQGVQLEKAKLGLKSARIQKATLLEQINKTNIKAPFDGIVTAKLSEEGAFAAPGVPLLQLTDISSLRFTVNVPENDLAKFQIDRLYSISADAYPDISLSGKVVMIGSKANMGNSFPVQLQVPNTKSLAIKSGMFGKVILSSNKPEQGIVIPSSAISEDNGKAQVYVVKNGKAILQQVSVSKIIRSKSVIESGLNEGDIVVTSGFINLFEGANIIIK